MCVQPSYYEIFCFLSWQLRSTHTQITTCLLPSCSPALQWFSHTFCPAVGEKDHLKRHEAAGGGRVFVFFLLSFSFPYPYQPPSTGRGTRLHNAPQSQQPPLPASHGRDARRSEMERWERMDVGRGLGRMSVGISN